MGMRAAAVTLVAVLVACTAAKPPRSDIGRSETPPEPPTGSNAASDGSASNDANATDGANPASVANERHGPMALEVPNFLPALVVLPHEKERPARLLVAAHGAGDSPEWQCEHWGNVARGRYFVLCPRGTSLGGGGYYYKTHIALEQELVAALAAVRETYGSLVKPGGGIYTGYSQGATMGALMIIDHGTEFPHLVLVEGGWGDWTLGRAKRFAATGGRSVALVCGGSGCAQRAEAAAKVLERAGLRARAEHAEGGGHTYVGIVGERATDLFETWLLKSD